MSINVGTEDYIMFYIWNKVNLHHSMKHSGVYSLEYNDAVLCLIVCDLETSTKCHSSLRFGSNTTERK